MMCLFFYIIYILLLFDRKDLNIYIRATYYLLYKTKYYVLVRYPTILVLLLQLYLIIYIIPLALHSDIIIIYIISNNKGPIISNIITALRIKLKYSTQVA